MVTATIIIAVVVAVIQGWGILKQNKKIWINQSGKSLPLTFFAFQFFYCLGYLLYGFRINSGALIISNLVGLLYIPIIIGLIKFKRRESGSFKEELRLSPIFILTVPLILFINKEWALIAILALAILVISKLIREFMRTKDTQNVSPKFIISFLVSSLIWLGYGYEINDFGLMISSSTTALGAILFLAMYLIFKYKIFNTKSPTND
jgi:uncharacterized protein with PQ loop repeat